MVDLEQQISAFLTLYFETSTIYFKTPILNWKVENKYFEMFNVVYVMFLDLSKRAIMVFWIILVMK